MEWSSGAGTWRSGPSTAVVLRLLPFVHHPPAKVMVLGDDAVARSLDARGYRLHDGAGLDLLCEAGAFAIVSPEGRAGYFDRAAEALRPGGQLFGAFPAGDAGALISALSAHFDVARLDPSAFGGEGGAWLEAVFVRR